METNNNPEIQTQKQNINYYDLLNDPKKSYLKTNGRTQVKKVKKDIFGNIIKKIKPVKLLAPTWKNETINT
jgi:hypothetical protein